MVTTACGKTLNRLLRLVPAFCPSHGCGPHTRSRSPTPRAACHVPDCSRQPSTPERSCEGCRVRARKLHAGPALHGLDPVGNAAAAVLLHPVPLQLVQRHQEPLHEGPPDQVTLRCSPPRFSTSHGHTVCVCVCVCVCVVADLDLPLVGCAVWLLAVGFTPKCRRPCPLDLQLSQTLCAHLAPSPIITPVCPRPWSAVTGLLHRDVLRQRLAAKVDEYHPSLCQAHIWLIFSSTSPDSHWRQLQASNTCVSACQRHHRLSR